MRLEGERIFLCVPHLAVPALPEATLEWTVGHRTWTRQCMFLLDGSRDWPVLSKKSWIGLSQVGWCMIRLSPNRSFRLKSNGHVALSQVVRLADRATGRGRVTGGGGLTGRLAPDLGVLR